MKTRTNREVSGLATRTAAPVGPAPTGLGVLARTRTHAWRLKLKRASLKTHTHIHEDNREKCATITHTHTPTEGTRTSPSRVARRGRYVCALAVWPKIQHRTKLGMATRWRCCRRRNDKSDKARAQWRRLVRRLRRVQRLKRVWHWLGRWLCYLKHGNRYYKLSDTDND